MMRGLLIAGLMAAAPALGAPTAAIAPFGTGADGKAVQVVTLTNDHGMIVRFSTRGGTVLEISAPDRAGQSANLVLGRPDFASWDRGGSFNSVVGRYANRIGGGGFTLDGQRHDLAGANPNSGVVIHGGPDNFSRKVWETATFAADGRAGATMTLQSADGENGFPGEVAVTMTYSLDNAGCFRIEYRATTTKPTVINLTNHSYFNMAGAASGPVYGQLLWINAGSYTPTDDRQVPTGEIATVEGTPFDFRVPATIGSRVYSTHPQMLLARGLDHNFVLDGSGLRDVATLLDPSSGRKLVVRTTEPGMQVYSGNNLNGGQLGEGGRTLRQSDGIAFETQHFPDSPNKPGFPSTVLRPGETFHSITEYVFSVDRGQQP